MIIKCPECGHDLSDKAASCPNCGYPMSKSSNKKSSKRMRLPNGFGRITKITGKRLRKPYRAVVTVGKQPDGQLITKMLKPGYYSTYNEAYQALLEYHKSPYYLDKDISLKELYEMWMTSWKDGKSDSSIRGYKAAWNFCSPLYEVKVRELKTGQIRECISNGTRTTAKGEEIKITDSIRTRVKILFDQMLDYAIEMDIVDKNCAKSIKLSPVINDEEDDEHGHIPFTKEEFELIEDNIDDEFVRLVYVHCYMGWRPNEFITIKLSEVNLDKGYIKHGAKTKAGKNRTVPIHSKIKPIIDGFFTKSSKLGVKELITYKGKSINYHEYYRLFAKMVSDFNLDQAHRPHDCRVTFVTMAKAHEVNDIAIKLIVGHAIQDITESVYTKRDTEWLSKELEKVP